MESLMWMSAIFCVLSVVAATVEYDFAGSYRNYNGAFQQDWTGEWDRISRPKCIDIPENLTLCQNLGYDKMGLPNLLDHDTLSEVTQQARSWVPLLNIHCHPDSKLFLCSLFSPVCLERTIWPCRSLCESVKAACIERMKYYNFDWPEMVRCDKFPVDNDLCIKQQNYNKPDNNCTACKHPMTYEAIVDNYCRSQFVIRTSVMEVQHVASNSVIILKKKKKFYKKEATISKREKKDMAFVIKGGSQCQCNLVNDTKTKFLMMGNRTGNDIVLTFVVPWEKRNKAFKRALKKIKKGHKCADLFNHEIIGMPTELPTDTNTERITKVNGKGKGKGRGRGKGKGKGKKKKGGKGGKKNKKKGKKGRNGKRKGKKRRQRKERKRKGSNNAVQAP